MAGAAVKICLKLKHVDVVLHHQRILKDISLVVEEQEIVSIIGPNGAGKTTLFNVISGSVRPSAGRIFFHDRDITGRPPHSICRAGIGRTFQIARPFPEMTALENIQTGLCFGKDERRAFGKCRDEALELLQVVGLSSKADEPARELTLSEQRRLELARALGTRPHLLLLDEMAAGMSPHAIKHAVELVRTLRNRGLSLLLVDHFLNLTAQVSDRLVALDQGEKIAEGKPSDVMRHPEVISAYLGERQTDLDE